MAVASSSDSLTESPTHSDSTEMYFGSLVVLRASTQSLSLPSMSIFRYAGTPFSARICEKGMVGTGTASCAAPFRDAMVLSKELHLGTSETQKVAVPGVSEMPTFR